MAFSVTRLIVQITQCRTLLLISDYEVSSAGIIYSRTPRESGKPELANSEQPVVAKMTNSGDLWRTVANRGELWRTVAISGEQ